jgi:SAM-dependent methyltransferase
MDDHGTWLSGVFDRAAPTYDRIGEAYHGHFAERLVALVDPPSDARLLDIACGRGAVLHAAAVRGVGRLAGIDVSPAMVELARADLGAARVTDVDLRVMDAARLDFPDGAFDVLTAAFVLFFLPDPARAAGEWHRVLGPGGVVAVSTWGVEDERWSFEDDLLPVAESPRVGAVHQPFDRPDDVTGLLGSAGFSDLRVHVEETEIHFVSKEQWWEWHWSFSVRGLLEQLGPDDLRTYRDGCFRAMDALETSDGYPLRLQALMVVGQR